MPTTRSLTEPTQEPVSLALLKAHLRLSGDQEDELLQLYLAAARGKAETYTGRYFASREVETTYSIDEPFALVNDTPCAAILSVSGAVDSVESLGDRSYFNNYRKGIIISRDLPIDYENLPTYTVRYILTVAPETVPAAVKTAIMKLAGDLYENRENSTAGVSNQELAISYKTLLAPYRINLYS